MAREQPRGTPVTTLWNRLSVRERRLAMAAGAAVGLMILYLMIMPAVMYIAGLNLQIDSLEDEVYNSTAQAARSEVVSKRYNELASAHSTGWTEAEINDGLQRELDRLSLSGVLDKKTGGAGKLLEITYRPEGQLTDFNGYREYQTTFSTQLSFIGPIAEFVRRIQASPQALRIDKLDLRRDNPSTKHIVAQITVTRTVVDSKEGSTPAAPVELPKGNFARNASFETWDESKLTPPDWELAGATAVPDATHVVDGKAAVKVLATDAGAMIYQTHKLVAGQKYSITVLGATKNEAVFQVIDGKTRKPLPGAQTMVADGNLYEYALKEFVAPGTEGEEVELGIPCIALKDKDSVVFLDKVVLEAVAP